MNIKLATYMQSYPMIISKLVILVKLLVNLPVNQERRRFYLGNSSSFWGMLRGSELLMPLVRCLDYLLSRVYYRATTPLPTCITDFYRTLPTFYRFFGLSWETSAINNYHSQDSLYYFFSTTPSAHLGLFARLITSFSISSMVLLQHACVFFSRFLESRNYKIRIVARVGRKSAVVPSGVVEASYSHFFIGRVLLS